MTDTSALDQALLRMVLLTGGTTRAYTRVKNGKLQQVSQYRTPQRVHRLAWGSLVVGMKVNLGNSWYQVVAVNVALSSNEIAYQSAGSKAAARKEKSQGPSQAQKAATHNAQVASAKARKSGLSPAAKVAAKTAAKKRHLKLRNLQTGRESVMSQPSNLLVWVG